MKKEAEVTVDIRIKDEGKERTYRHVDLDVAVCTLQGIQLARTSGDSLHRFVPFQGRRTSAAAPLLPA